MSSKSKPKRKLNNDRIRIIINIQQFRKYSLNYIVSDEFVRTIAHEITYTEKYEFYEFHEH